MDIACERGGYRGGRDGLIGSDTEKEEEEEEEEDFFSLKIQIPNPNFKNQIKKERMREGRGRWGRREGDDNENGDEKEVVS